MSTWCVPAYAKINLGLRILGKRPDGYHELETYFLQINLADRLFFEKSHRSGLQLTCDRPYGHGPDIPVDASNLCFRAYQLLCEATNCQFGVRLHLEKNIPVGAGLGGGSSDAAVTLMALNRLFDRKLSDTQMYQLAAQLGSDVPFFLAGGLCLGSGRGEILTAVSDLPDFWILLITPAIVVSTAWAYKNLHKMGLTNRQKNSTLSNFDVSRFTAHGLVDICQNDLETVVFQGYPELAKIKTKLQHTGTVVASMTGSGSALYGIFGTQQEAQYARQFFVKDYATHVTRPIRWGIREVYQNYAALTSEGVYP
jgi:4-diphosphocytidyl-2-C-methyl-D-erythritol kinase